VAAECKHGPAKASMDRTTLNAIVNEYAGHLQAEKGLGQASQERYLALVRGLLALCQHDPDALFLPPEWTLADLDRRVVESYLNALKAERGWKPMSHAFYITSLSAFFGFLKARHHITRNPCDRLRPHLGNDLDAPPTGDAKAVLRMFDDPADTLDGARRQLLLQLLYGAGLKPTQAFHIAELDVPPSGSPVRYRLEGTWHEISLSPEGVDRARRYLMLRAALVESQAALLAKAGSSSERQTTAHEAFWVDRRGRPCSVGRLSRQVSRAMESVGLSGGPSTLRVLAARHFSESGADVRSVQQLLKARRLGQLDRFAPEADLKSLMQQFRRAHPRQND
jgi:integrase/recombinase XerC